MDLGMSWENGNRTGFSQGPDSVELTAVQAKPDTGFSDPPASPDPDA